MRPLFKMLLAVLVNGVALWLADYYVPGFILPVENLKILLAATIVLTLLNYILRPILTLILGPIIILTLGLGALLVNAIILKVLDFLSPALSIQGLMPLLGATLIVSAVNIIFHFATKRS